MQTDPHCNYIQKASPGDDQRSDRKLDRRGEGLWRLSGHTYIEIVLAISGLAGKTLGASLQQSFDAADGVHKCG